MINILYQAFVVIKILFQLLTNYSLNVSDLVKKTDYGTRVNEIEMKITDHSHDKYITTPEFNKVKQN